ncbi:PREDICTED: splicing factor [Prunus dulcis]|uniref:PREDICTED: splicing factor n=1 Tax=Prunus dulcis TaxID=3755 RepID=A0A5E4ESN3_PRUDU|nr:PREDICTED: splicing factor [Prunus dulcis]
MKIKIMRGRRRLRPLEARLRPPPEPTFFFSAFYDRLKEIRKYYRKHPAAAWGVFDAANEEEDEEEDALLLKIMAEFSGEEAFGRYVDLHEMYNQYINSKFGQPIEYSAYLDVFSQPQSQNIPRKLKLLRQYKEYLPNLVAYLIYFFQRTEPLQDLDAIFSKAEETEFEDQESGHLLQQDQLTLTDRS